MDADLSDRCVKYYTSIIDPDNENSLNNTLASVDKIIKDDKYLNKS